MNRNIINVLFVTVLLSFHGCGRHAVPESAMITFIIGEVTKNNAEAVIGDSIRENDVIVTSAGSFCDVKMGGSLIRIKALSNVTISSMVINVDRESVALGMDEGVILCKPKKLSGGDFFIVRTPSAVASARGTQFSVESDRMYTTRIRVFSGEVKVIRRVKQLDSDSMRILQSAPSVKKEEKVVVTAYEARGAEKLVERVFKDETGKSAAPDVIERVISRTKDDLAVQKEKIEKFRAEDFVSDNREIIEVEERPEDVRKRISMLVKQEKEMPSPEGRMLVTQRDVYFIKDGRARWSSRLTGDPARKGDRIFVAAGEYVFCAMSDGPVVWRRALANDGRIEVKNGMVTVFSNGKAVNLGESTGE